MNVIMAEKIDLENLSEKEVEKVKIVSDWLCSKFDGIAETLWRMHVSYRDFLKNAYREQKAFREEFDRKQSLIDERLGYETRRNCQTYNA